MSGLLRVTDGDIAPPEINARCSTFLLVLVFVSHRVHPFGRDAKEDT
jgi:hypothetical protein